MNLLPICHGAFALTIACTAAPLLQACGGDAVAQTPLASPALDHGENAQGTSPNAPAARAQGDAVEGTWESSVTLQDCTTGAVLRTFKGLTVLHHGGSASATNNLPPAAGSPAYGTWRRATVANTYELRLRFFRFNADGSWAGAQNLARHITLLDRNTLTGTLSAQVLDNADNILQTVCGSETATRVAPA